MSSTDAPKDLVFSALPQGVCGPKLNWAPSRASSAKETDFHSLSPTPSSRPSREYSPSFPSVGWLFGLGRRRDGWHLRQQERVLAHCTECIKTKRMILMEE